MLDSTTTLYRGQVVGKIDYIIQSIERIDPQKKTHMRDNNKHLFTLHQEPFERLLSADFEKQLPDSEALSNTSWIIQNIENLLGFIKPYSMNPACIDTLYKNMSCENKQTHPKYDSLIRSLTALKQQAQSPTSPGNEYLKVFVSLIQKHMCRSTNTLIDPVRDAFIKKAQACSEMAVRHPEDLYPLLKDCIMQQPDAVIERNAHPKLSKLIKTHIQNTLTLDATRKKLQNLRTPKRIDTHYFQSMNAICALDKQIHAYATTYALDVTALDAYLLKNDQGIDERALKQFHVNYLITELVKHYPTLKGPINNYRPQTPAGFFDSEFLYNILHEMVSQKVSENDALDTVAVHQLVDAACNKIITLNLNSTSHVMQLGSILQNHAESTIQNVVKRKQILSWIEADVKINKEIPEKYTPIITAFQEAIQKAKHDFFYTQKESQWEIKAIESLDKATITAFFDRCVEAGRSAQNELQDARSTQEAIVDALHAIIYWALRLFSSSTVSPSFFKPHTAALHSLSESVDTLKENMLRSLNELEQAPDCVSSSITATT